MAYIAVVGTGYVGLTTGVCLADMGHNVCCIDIDAGKIARLERGILPIYEPGLDELVIKNMAAGRLRFSTEYGEGLSGVEFVFIGVGTPTAADGHSADMRYVYAAVRSIAQTLSAPAIIINKSTSPIGTVNRIETIMAEARPDLAPWRVVSNPEFLREGCAVYDCRNPARIVIGSKDQSAAEAAARLYDSLACPVVLTDPNTAEMVKYASNAFLATRISFINEVSRICEGLGADVLTVARGMGLDPRIGPAFLNAGLGYGGSCFPKDVAALAYMAGEAGQHPQLLESVIAINAAQRLWPIEKLEAHYGNLHGVQVGIWGMAFKPNTDDLRKAPALEIMKQLAQRGAMVRCYDPIVGAHVARMGLPITVCETAEEAAQGADALLLVTEWGEFGQVCWPDIAFLMRGTLVLDGRNALDAEAVSSAGLHYVGVGRPLRQPERTPLKISA